ncbi:MAG TPA: hypothetical protein VGR67_08285 [Candidatus Polarisedimenticolia bacterium]|jgi:hypothetical protein|nr:hypothetical protein [Candidatus Polarisedimenticolia bacterium]
MTVLIGLLILGLLALLAFPLLLATAAIVLAVHLLLLPFKILGLGVKAGLGLAGALVKGCFLIAGILLAILVAIGLIPLVPLLLLGIGIYLLLRPSRAPLHPAR